MGPGSKVKESGRIRPIYSEKQTLRNVAIDRSLRSIEE